jgi:Na+-translocating ferredoxin:NAD+ oxidoreductase RnfD subunit
MSFKNTISSLQDSVSAPFLHSGHSTAQYFWKKSALLIPLLLLSLIRGGGMALITYGAMLAGGLLADAAGRILRDRGISFRDGCAFFTMTLFFLILPPQTPAWMAALSAFAGMLAARELWGGLGQTVFHPALTAFVFLKFFSAGGTSLSSLPEGWIGIAAALLGAAGLAGLKLIRWEASLLYLAVLFALSKVLSAETLLLAFWFLTDVQSAPLTRAAHCVHALAAALLTAAASEAGHSFKDAAVFSLLFTSALNPWLEHWLRPKGSRR